MLSALGVVSQTAFFLSFLISFSFSAEILCCADDGQGTPTGFVKFPGAYQPDEVALSLPEGEEIVNGTDAAAIWWRHGFLGYVPPGPAVWRG